MSKPAKNKIIFSTVALLFIILIFLIVVVNRWVENALDYNTDVSNTVFTMPVQKTQEQPEQKSKETELYIGGDATRRAMLDPNRRYTNNYILVEDKVIGSYKNINDKIFDVEGQLPEGRVEFNNVTTKTHGEEYWHNGKKSGHYVEYYENGNIKKEADYFNGEAVKVKAYFASGRPRFELDMSDALWESNSHDNGVGKKYNMNGSLRYEWNITNMGKGGYAKSYDFYGKLMETKIFDANGNLIEIKKY